MNQAGTVGRQLLSGLPEIQVSPIQPDAGNQYNHAQVEARHSAGRLANERGVTVRKWWIVIAVVLSGAVAWAAYDYWSHEKSEKAGKTDGHKGHVAAKSGEDDGDEKGGDEKGGDEKGGDEKGGDEKSGDEKSGDEKGGDEKGGKKKRSPRTTKQPGSLIPDKSAELYAKVSGYLKVLGTDLDGKPLDIGSRVKEGQMLAKIDMPELVAEVDRDKAALTRAEATVDQMTARITTAKAAFDAATKMLSYRKKVYKRLDQLARVEKAMDFRVVDEREERMDAAEEAKNAAAARILEAKADLEEAEAAVKLAKATLQLAQVNLDYATIVSPYDGVITTRNYWPGDFIRAHEEGGKLPLLAVHKIDVVRVVVLIPDADVPFVNPGNKATVTIDNLPDKKPKDFEGVGGPVIISRIADAEDPMTRNMRVEIDLVNKDGDLRAGMFGHTIIDLDPGESVVTKAEH